MPFLFFVFHEFYKRLSDRKLSKIQTFKQVQIRRECTKGDGSRRERSRVDDRRRERTRVDGKRQGSTRVDDRRRESTRFDESCGGRTRVWRNARIWPRLYIFTLSFLINLFWPTVIVLVGFEVGLPSIVWQLPSEHNLYFSFSLCENFLRIFTHSAVSSKLLTERWRTWQVWRAPSQRQLYMLQGLFVCD